MAARPSLMATWLFLMSLRDKANSGENFRAQKYGQSVSGTGYPVHFDLYCRPAEALRPDTRIPDWNWYVAGLCCRRLDKHRAPLGRCTLSVESRSDNRRSSNSRLFLQTPAAQNIFSHRGVGRFGSCLWVSNHHASVVYLSAAPVRLYSKLPTIAVTTVDQYLPEFLRSKQP